MQNGIGDCLRAGAIIKSGDGVTVAQLQTLNFAAMDLSEFYASLVPTLPNVNALQAGSANRVPTCYYGQGKCQ